jgi:hypothetical protein
MLVLSQYHIFESYKTNIYRAKSSRHFLYIFLLYILSLHLSTLSLPFHSLFSHTCTHPAPTKYLYIDRAPQCMSLRRSWDSPSPSPASECAPPPFGPGGGTLACGRGVGWVPRCALPPPDQRVGGHTRLRLKGWGRPNSDDWRKSLALCLLCVSIPPISL